MLLEKKCIVQELFNAWFFPEMSQGRFKKYCSEWEFEFQQIYYNDNKHSLPLAFFDALMQKRI